MVASVGTCAVLYGMNSGTPTSGGTADHEQSDERSLCGCRLLSGVPGLFTRASFVAAASVYTDSGSSSTQADMRCMILQWKNKNQ